MLFADSGRDPKSWRSLPKAMLRGDVSLIKDWSPAQAIDVLHKLCHDMIVVGAGGKPRFFEATDLPPPTSMLTLTVWGRQLALSSRTAEHPFNTGLMLEALVSQAQRALNSGH
jgi:DNA polymerase-3 subunit delta'